MQIELLIRARCLRYLPMNQFSKQYFVLKSIRIIGVYSFVTYRQIRRPSNIRFSGTGICPWLERGRVSCGMFLIEVPRFLTPAWWKDEFRRQKLGGSICCVTFSVYFLTMASQIGCEIMNSEVAGPGNGELRFVSWSRDYLYIVYQLLNSKIQ